VFQNPLERYGYRSAAKAAAKKKDLPLLHPWSDRSRSKLGTPVTLEDLEKAARSQHPMPRRLAAKAREELRQKKAKSARDMAKRKALLPYLEGIQYTDQEVDRVKATIRAEAEAPDTFGRDVRASHAHWAASELQRWTRGELKRERLRAWNAHEMLAAAYANTAKLLCKRQRAAARIRCLARTNAFITKHPAAGDGVRPTSTSSSTAPTRKRRARCRATT